MPRTASNQLTIEPTSDNRFRLAGYIDAADKSGIFTRTRIRLVSADLAELDAEKNRLETEAEAHAKRVKSAMGFLQTWLTEDQLRDAEAAYRRLPAGRTLFECVEAAALVLGSGKPVSCVDALAAWVKNMQDRRLEQSTIDENESRVTRFLTACKKAMVGEIQPRVTEDYIRRKGIAPLTAVGDARVLSAWGNFCKREKFISQNFVQLDIGELKERARPVAEPDILTPEQSQALLEAALGANGGQMVLFTIFSLWCFMRKSEVLRLRPADLRVTKAEAGKPAAITIHLRGKKLGSKWRTIPVPAALVPLVLACLERGDLPADEIDKNKVLKQAGGVHFSEWDWRHIRARAGLISLKVNPENPNRPVINESNWCANLLRHTGMTYRFQESGDIQLTTNQAGNSEEVAFMHYLRDVEVDAHKKFYAITGELAQDAAQAVA